jgi:hypothetical protein
MTEQTDLIAREQEAFLALEQIRAAISARPDNHPLAAQPAQALALAERHWHECQAAVAEATREAKRTETKHPGDYWSARWRT